MEAHYKIIAINTGSTSTKVACFEDDREVFSSNVSHDADTLKTFREVNDQLDYRRETIAKEFEKAGISLKNVDAFVGRGGGQLPLPSGTYEVKGLLLEHARLGLPGHHPAQLAAQICFAFKEEFGGQAYVVNPPDVDEFDEISRITGLADVFKGSHIHALNQKEVALRYSASINKAYSDLNLILCHIGGGISVTAHRLGRMVDSNDILHGDGPMTPNRSGSIVATEVIRLCFSGKYTQKEIMDRIMKNGGLLDHLGTADAKEVERRIKDGDKRAELIYNAMIYQISKCVGSCAVTLKGKVDAVILTGGISHSEYLTNRITEQVDWIAPVVVIPGEFEMEALGAGALRVLRGDDQLAEYSGQAVWGGLK